MTHSFEYCIHMARIARETEKRMKWLDKRLQSYQREDNPHFSGKAMDIKLPGYNVCPVCKGTGERFTKRLGLTYGCLKCDGTGVIPKRTHRSKV